MFAAPTQKVRFMQKKHVLLLFDYGYWATQRILKAAAHVSIQDFTAPRSYSHGGLRGTLVHALAAEQLWRIRCQERSSPTSLALKEEDFPDLVTLRDYWQGEERLMRSYLNRLDDMALSQSIRYRFFDGNEYEHLLWQVLIHVVNHGTQHRSEAAVMLTDLDCSPGNIDLSVYLRELHQPPAKG
jgi:uncharacterized damage-inducible protein DinB